MKWYQWWLLVCFLISAPYHLMAHHDVVGAIYSFTGWIIISAVVVVPVRIIVHFSKPTQTVETPPTTAEPPSI